MFPPISQLLLPAPFPGPLPYWSSSFTSFLRVWGCLLSYPLLSSPFLSSSPSRFSFTCHLYAEHSQMPITGLKLSPEPQTHESVYLTPPIRWLIIHWKLKTSKTEFVVFLSTTCSFLNLVHLSIFQGKRMILDAFTFFSPNVLYHQALQSLSWVCIILYMFSATFSDPRHVSLLSQTPIIASKLVSML